jgi:hypothetical protein
MSENQTIELRSYYPDKTQDISSSRIPLVKREDDRKMHNLQLKVEREFRKFTSITSLKKVMFFIYKCLFVDVIVNVLYAYQLIQAVTDISKINLCFFYLIEYAISLWNAVLYLKIIINYNDYKKETDRLREESAGLNKKEKKKIHREEKLANITVYLNKPMQGINRVISYRLLSWILKYFVYISIIYMQTIFPVFEYFTILIMLLEYILIQRLSFNFKVLMRIEAYKELYNFEEQN